MIGKQLKHRSQQGVVLIISLLFLTIMTILGVSAMSNNVLEEKMVSNVRQQRIIFQAADSCNSRLLKNGEHTFGDWDDVWKDDSGNSKRMGIGGTKSDGNKMAYYSARYKHQMNTLPPRNSGFSHKFRASHNEYECTGEDKATGSSTVKAVLRQGVYQIVPNPES